MLDRIPCDITPMTCLRGNLLGIMDLPIPACMQHVWFLRLMSGGKIKGEKKKKRDKERWVRYIIFLCHSDKTSALSTRRTALAQPLFSCSSCGSFGCRSDDGMMMAGRGLSIVEMRSETDLVHFFGGSGASAVTRTLVTSSAALKRREKKKKRKEKSLGQWFCW